MMVGNYISRRERAARNTQNIGDFFGAVFANRVRLTLESLLVVAVLSTISIVRDFQFTHRTVSGVNNDKALRPEVKSEIDTTSFDRMSSSMDSSDDENESVTKSTTTAAATDASTEAGANDTANEQEQSPKDEFESQSTQPESEEAAADTEEEADTKANTDADTATETQRSSSSSTSHRIPRLINDITLTWNETMHRPWLDNQRDNHSNTSQPPFMILLTNVGWNHPNQTYGLTMPRSLRERELFEGIVNHPYFHPTAWEEMRNGSMPIPKGSNFYVFADVSQCQEINYPFYGGHFEDNLDTLYNRSVDPDEFYTRISKCKRQNKFEILKHPIFQNNGEATSTDTDTDNTGTNSKSKATLVVFNCQGNGPTCQEIFDDVPISVAAIGGHFPNMDLRLDQGLIPPAPNPIQLSPEEEAAIASCEAETNLHSRPVKVVYAGNFRSGRNSAFHEKHGGARMSYMSFHDPEEGFFMMEKDDLRDIKNTEISIRLNNSTDSDIHILKNPTYDSLLRSTKFALAPRGDNKFSYRFTEVLSAGAIPVYHGDDHMLPFRPELVDWTKCGLFLPERDAGQVGIDLIMQHLADDPDARAKLCAMRQYCYFGIYKKYVETTTKQIDGMVQGLEALASGGEQKVPVGVICNETSIANLDCNPIR